MDEIMQKNFIQEIDISNYEKLNEIGFGGFGKVFKVRNKKNNKYYAAKLITKINENPKNIYREVMIPESLEHPCIIQFHGFCCHDFDGDPYPMIFTEYMSKGSLFHMLDLQRRGSAPLQFDDTIKYIIMFGIAKGMQYLHDQNIIHRDLKTLNILLNDLYWPVICDFGLSKIVDPNERDVQSTKSGTCAYQAPEIFMENCDYRYNEKVDVYAFGIVLYEIVTGLIPFSSCKKPYDIINQHKIRKDFRPVFPKDGIDEEIKSIIQECWDYDPNLRPPFSAIVKKLFNKDLACRMNVDWEKFSKYAKFISDSREFFNPNAINTFTPLDRIDQIQMEKSLKIYPRLELKKLTERCQKMVENAENGNIELMYHVGRNLIRGDNDFPRNVELGIQFLNKSIENKCSKARAFKGAIYYEGKYVPKNVKKAMELLTHPTLRNDPNSILILTKIDLENPKPNYETILKNLNYLSKLGNHEAMILNAKLYMKNNGIKNNFKESLNISYDLFKKAKKYNVQEAKAYLSLFYYYGYGVVDFDFNKAAELSRSSYEEDQNMTGAAIYAECLAKGRGVAKNEILAVKIAKESSDKNNCKGMNKYGEFLNVGIGEKEINKKKACKLWKKSSELGDEEGKFLYASCLFEGEEYEISKNPKEGIKLLKESIEGGCITAMALYGQLLIQGYYVERDNVNGIKLIKEAADLGDDFAIIIYSNILAKGIGTGVNYEEALHYLTIGMKRKNSDCYRLYGELIDHGFVLPKKIGKDGNHYIQKADVIEWKSKEILQKNEEDQKKLDEIEKNQLDEEKESEIDNEFNHGCFVC